MVAPLLLAALQATMVTPAPPMAQAIPATRWSCAMSRPDGSRFTLAGLTPLFPVGFDPNRSAPIAVTGDGPATIVGRASVSPGHASDYFREFQISSRWAAERFKLNLSLRRAGTSIATMTRYEENERREPYDHYAVGFCTAEFAPS
jgi:hypothetical protein